jgi:hypothetical protein
MRASYPTRAGAQSRGTRSPSRRASPGR